MVLYRQAAEANNSSDDCKLVYLTDLDDSGPSDEQPIDPGAFPPPRT
jgi:hypothetical protein